MKFPAKQILVILFITLAFNAFSQVSTITKKLQAGLISQNISDTDISSYLKDLKDDGSWADVNYSDRSNTNWDPITHLRRLLRMCQVYNKPGSKFFHNEVLKGNIIKVISFYISARPESNNWWFNAIGAPQEIGPALVLMKSDDGSGIEQPSLEKYASALLNYYDESLVKWPHSNTGANKIWLLGSSINKACIFNNEAVLKTNFLLAFEEAAVMTGRKEGIKQDQSFWQHGPQLYNAGYGMSFLSDITSFGTLANGTEYAMSPSQLKIITDAVLDGWQWFCQNGSFDFSSAGREISRRGAVSSASLKNYGTRLITMDAPRQEELRKMIDFIDGKKPFQSPGNRHFWKSDIMVQHGPDFYLSARMPSSRMNATESMNNENLKRKWLPWGAMSIMSEGDEYRNIYAIWDWSRIPGVTSYREELRTATLKGPKEGAYLVSATEFAGGVSDGTSGMAAYDFSWDGVSARKAWFFTPDGVYCIGSNIKGEKDLPVITSINQCFSSGDITIKEGKEKSILKDEEHSGNINWIWHDRFGYVFPSGGKITVRNAVQTGSWSEINNSQSKDIISSKIFSAWMNHDRESTNYEYIIVPAANPARMDKWTAKNPFRLVTNTMDIQAVYNRNTGVYAIALYNPGTITISKKFYIGADKPCLMLYKALQGNKISVTVADPTQKLEKVIVLVSAKVSGEGVTIHEETSEISVNLPSGDDAGKSVSVELSLL